MVHEIQVEATSSKKEKKVSSQDTQQEQEDEKPIEISFEQMQGMPSGEMPNGLKWEWVEVDDDYVPEQDRVKDEL